MTRSWLSALTLIVVAAGLFVGLTHFGQEVDTFNRDHTSARSSPGRLILPPLGGRVFSPRCAASSPCKVALVAVTNGLYARGFIPPEVARIGGVVVPLLLLSFAGYLALSELRGPWRVIAALPLFTGGLISLFPLATIVYVDTHYYQYLRKVSLLDDLISPLLLSTIAASGMLFGGVVWVVIDTFRGRQNKR